MATFDLRLVLYTAGAAMGLVLIAVAALGEFVFGWWNDAGLWLTLGGLAITLALGLLAASRFQVRELGGAIREVRDGVGRLEASSGRIEGNTQRIEASTAQAVVLLREIRDRLPAPAR